MKLLKDTQVILFIEAFLEEMAMNTLISFSLILDLTNPLI